MNRREFLAVAATASLAAIARAQVPALASGKAEYGMFGLDLAGMDQSISPGDDFYGYMNGTWARNTPIPADRSNYGMFTILDDLSRERTREILDGLQADPSSRAGRAYASYLDQGLVEARGLAPLQPWLARVRETGRDGYAALVAEAQEAGIRTPFPNLVGQDDRHPDQYIISLFQGGIGMPDRDYYLLDTEKMRETRAAYLRHLETMLTFTGRSDSGSRAAAILALESEIASAHWTRIDSRDAEKTYNRWTLARLQQQAPGFDFGVIFAVGGQPVEELLVAQPDAIEATARAIAAAPLEVLRDQLLVRSLEAYADFLPDTVADASFAFYGTELTGTPERQPRWKRAVDFAVGAVTDDISRVYVARHFPPETKAAADQLVANILAAMGRRIDGLSWMSAATKEKARAKLAGFTAKIGYPERWRDYAGLEIDSRDLFGNAWRSNRFDFAYERGKLGQPLRRWEWFMTPMTINAYANFAMVEIVFPAAILQPPFFDPNADDAVNYGAIGAVIGHEVSHHFDDQGAKYDVDGRLADWWTADDMERFKALGDRLVAQYDAYQPLPGQHVQGALTLGENIGDLAGLAVAFEAYHATLGDSEPPVIDGLTGEQRFFMAWAQVWRRNVRDAAKLQRLLTDPHAPDPYRADIVRNFDQWYEAFRPAAGGALVLPPEERVKIW